MASPSSVRGELACLKVEFRAYEKGAVVSKPTVECEYDRVLDYGGRLHRVQIKRAALKSCNANGSVIVDLRRPVNGKRKLLYNPKTVDALILYLEPTDQVLWVPIERVVGKQTVTVRYEVAGNNQQKGVLVAQDYVW